MSCLVFGANDLNVSLINPGNNSNFTSSPQSFSFNLNISSNCDLRINNSYVTNLSGVNTSLNTFSSIRLNNGSSIPWLVNCTGNLSTTRYYNALIMPQVTNFLSLTQCPQTISGSLTLWLIVILALFFIFLGFQYQLGFIGFFGALMLMICSWYISPCVQIFGYILAGTSFVFIIWFPIKGIGFNNDTFK